MWYDKKNIAFGVVISRFKFRLPLTSYKSFMPFEPVSLSNVISSTSVLSLKSKLYSAIQT